MSSAKMHTMFLGRLLGVAFFFNSVHYSVGLATINGGNMVSEPGDSDAENNAINASPNGRWDDDMEYLTAYLEQLLRDGEIWDVPTGPLLYVEDIPVPTVYNSETTEEDDGLSIPWKRSRYYRRYPWKRQNGRHRVQYSDSSRYMCNPSREDVFQLLVALHEAREGNTRRVVSFCNRKRPASAIYTNIRFLGRRK